MIKRGVASSDVAESEHDRVQHHNNSFSHHQDEQLSREDPGNYNKSAGGRADSDFLDVKGSDGINDPALLTQSSKIKFIPLDDLEPLENPEKEFKKAMAKNQGVYCSEWFEQFEACNIIRRVCKYHQKFIIQTGNQLNTLVVVLLKLVESLRSAVSRIALITLTEMFSTLKRVMEPCLDQVMKIVLKKGADANNFISDEADRCLQSLVSNCQENKVLMVIQMQNLNSRSNMIRLKLCQCLFSIVKSLGNNILFFKDNDKLIIQLAKYLQDASQDVRQTAKNSFIVMSQTIMGQNDLEKLLQRVLNEF